MSLVPTRAFRSLRPLRRIWRPFLGRPFRVAFGAALAALAALALLAMPVLAGRVLDAATAGSMPDVQLGCAWFAGAAAIEGALRYAARRVLIGESRRAEECLKRDLQRHMTRLPLHWFTGARTGDVVSRFTQDVETLRFTTGPTLLYGIQALVVAPGGIVLLAGTSPWLALCGAAAFAGMAIALRRLSPALERGSLAVQQALGDIAQHAAEAFGAIRLVHAAGLAVADTLEMRRRTQSHLSAGVELARLQARADFAIHATVELVLLAGLGFGALAVLHHGHTPGELLEFYALLGIQLAPLLALGFVVSGLPRAAGAAERLEELFREPREPAGAGSRPGPLAGAARIDVRNLSYSHPRAGRPALRDVSFVVEPGETVGIVGAVGSGKSTLLGLLLRLEDPPAGTVFVDGIDVLELEPRALRARFAVALQDPFLFDGTVEDNVRFGHVPADVPAALADAELASDLAGFRDGSRSTVGERGVTLSGGQRQRVALARALAADRPVLVLDDTLSAVDQETERRILANLARRRGGRTTLIATHRLSAVRDADRIVFLERGRGLAAGPHAELLRTCPAYAAAWRGQQEEAAFDGAAE